MTTPAHYLTMQTLAPMVRTAGFDGEPAAEALAISWAESGGNVWAIALNTTPGLKSTMSLDLGLCQYNTYWNPHMTTAQAFDPQWSLNRMHDLHAHYGYRLWTVYNNGRYLTHLNKARTALEL
jgi:Lysozyme like domain